MYSKRTVLDLVLPRVLSDEKLTIDDIVRIWTWWIMFRL